MAIPEFFAGQTVFITGGTGFIGKVLLEKLLRSCPDIKRVYLTVRPKKGVSVEERWRNASSIPLFDRLKKENPNALNKVFLINADMKKENLGISDSDRKILLEEVNIIYHVAATVQFVDNVIDTVTQNTKSTYWMAEMAKEMKNLKIFVYASTAYSNFYRPESEWDEKIYPAVQDWRVIFKLLDREPEQLAMLQEKLLCGHPNPYTFSKSLAEQVITSYNQFYPTAILRPSVVMPSVEEPMKGWVDSLNGMAALCTANGLGILRVARHTDEAHQDYVPVDVVAKSLIIVAWWAFKIHEAGKTPVYNCAMGKKLTIKTSDISKYCAELKFIEEYPSKHIVWVRELQLIENAYKYHVLFFFKQLLPACILDAGIYIFGGKPMFISIAKKLAMASQRLFKDFRFRKVHFPNDKCMELINVLEGSDAEVFGSEAIRNLAQLDVGAEIKNTYLGVVKYYLKEDLSKENLERNKKRYNRIKMLDKTLTVAYYSTLGYLAYSWINVSSIVESIREYLY